MSNTLINKEEILELISAKYDILEIMDTLGWETEDIVRRIKSDILRNLDLFTDLEL